MIGLLYFLSTAVRTEEVSALKTIRALRRDRGLTQFELALMVGVQPQAIYLWETGRRTPQVPQLRKLGEIFGMCSDEIVLVHEAESDNSDHRPRAERRPGESVPGRDQRGLVATNGSRTGTTARENE
jgi:DNA-binding XRE family transcriptional regulator